MDDVNSLNALVSLHNSQASEALEMLVLISLQLEAAGELRHGLAAMPGAMSIVNGTILGQYA